MYADHSRGLLQRMKLNEATAFISMLWQILSRLVGRIVKNARRHAYALFRKSSKPSNDPRHGEQIGAWKFGQG